MTAHNVFRDFHYGGEAEQYAFYRLPRVLFTDERCKRLSDGAKILYGLMLDRMSLSLKNGWVDGDNRVYIYFTLEDVLEYLNCKQDKGIKLLAELDSEKGIGLIERMKQGQGKPTRIYVKKFIASANPTEALTSEKPKSRVRKNRSQDLGKTDSSNTEYSNTNMNKDRMDVIDTREHVRQSIGYRHLCLRFDPCLIDDLVSLMTEVLDNPQPVIRIAGSEMPAHLARLQKDMVRLDERLMRMKETEKALREQRDGMQRACEDYMRGLYADVAMSRKLTPEALEEFLLHHYDQKAQKIHVLTQLQPEQQASYQPEGEDEDEEM